MKIPRPASAIVCIYLKYGNVTAETSHVTLDNLDIRESANTGLDWTGLTFNDLWGERPILSAAVQFNSCVDIKPPPPKFFP